MKLLRKLFKGISLTAAMFVFQACYGTGEGWYGETNMTFHVVSAEDGSPLPNVKIRSQLHTADTAYDWLLLGYTNEDGIASVWAAPEYDGRSYTIFRFIADDSTYAVKDTVINSIHNTVNIALSKVDNAQ